MADPHITIATGGQAGDSAPDWPRLYQRAAQALARSLAQRGELSPEEALHTVAAALPPRWAAWLRGCFARHAWTAADALVPADLLDTDNCPPDISGGRRELVRLALFGPGGQGRPREAKDREAAYQHLCAEIMREARDLRTLTRATTQALNHPDVQRDPTLAGMIRAYLSVREAELRARLRAQREEEDFETQLVHPFEVSPVTHVPTRAELLAMFQRVGCRLEDQLAQFDEEGARSTMARLCELRARYPVHIAEAAVQCYSEKFDRAIETRSTYRRQIDDLAERAVEAARAGEQKTASWLLRRMGAIRTLLPGLFSDAEFGAIRTKIAEGGEEYEHHELEEELLSRERSVAADIRRLGLIVHRFRKLAAKLPHDDERYLRAKAEYKQAAEEVRARDSEWLTGLMLELETLLDDLHDPSGRTQDQVDRFLASVRSTLDHMRRGIRAVQEEQSQSG
ncbi:MAG: hypothetical protein KKB50_21350 [Planctomycetes bacterium]|nr:hypothetical protein [Planctomycetota bacterium]